MDVLNCDPMSFDKKCELEFGVCFKMCIRDRSAADRSVMEKLVFSHAKHGAHIAAIRFGPPRRRTGTICNVRIGISLWKPVPVRLLRSAIWRKLYWKS